MEKEEPQCELQYSLPQHCSGVEIQQWKSLASCTASCARKLDKDQRKGGSCMVEEVRSCIQYIILRSPCLDEASRCGVP